MRTLLFGTIGAVAFTVVIGGLGWLLGQLAIAFGLLPVGIALLAFGGFLLGVVAASDK